MEENKEVTMEMGTLYDVNKNLIKSEKAMSQSALSNAFKDVKTFICKHNKYFMLLCHERRDYTVFNLKENNPQKALICVGELKECLDNRGQIHSIEKTEDGVAIEIWMLIENEHYCYYFFPYDEAVLEV